jgi:hypothetical protein
LPIDVGLNVVCEFCHIGEVRNDIVLTKSDRERELDGVFTYGLDRHHELVCSLLHCF